MSKHFSLFQTDSQYQAAKDNLDYPHVSLINTTGDLHYAKYVGQEVENAPFGSILMADVAANKLFYIEDSADYNLTDYPFADYKPIAVCIYDKASNANNEAVFISVQWMNPTQLGKGISTSYTQIPWGFNNVDLTEKVPGIRDTGSQHISSRVINEAMKPLVTVNYSGTSYTGDTGNGSSAAFCTCWRYSTPGTSEGDWYLPSLYDTMKYQQNSSTINSVLTNIKNIAGIDYLNSTYGDLLLSTDRSSTNFVYMQSTGDTSGTYNTQKTRGRSVRAVFIAHVQEL